MTERKAGAGGRRKALVWLPWLVASVLAVLLLWLVALPAAERRIGFSATASRPLPDELTLDDRLYRRDETTCGVTLGEGAAPRVGTWTVVLGDDRPIFGITRPDGGPPVAVLEDADDCLVTYVADGAP